MTACIKTKPLKSTARARSWALAIAVVLLIPCLPASAVKVPHLTGFQEVKWGDGVEAVTTKLRRKFTYHGKFSDGSPFFKGEVAGYRHCSIFSWFKKNRLHRVRVAFFSQDGRSSVDIFFDLWEKLGNVYGKGTNFGLGYRDGDEIDLSQPENNTGEKWEEYLGLLKQGRLYLYGRWVFLDENRLVLQVLHDDDDNSLFVGLDYDSPKTEQQLEKTLERDL